MADGNNADSHHSLSLDALHHVPKDMQGSDNSLPLSPQWLLPKPGDNKHGLVAPGESHLSPYPGYASRSGISKSSRNGEDILDTEKKRDVFRPSVHDVDSGRRDRWRDEERDCNSAIRRDRRKDGEKEIGDTRKMDRWVDTSVRNTGEQRRAPSDRWTDSNNRDANYDQRRDNKWNTRWGPDDKESESWREKAQDSGRDTELPRDKVLSHATSHGKEDKEVDQYRPWRSNSSQSRGRGEPPHLQTLTQNRQSPTFNYGRGRGENTHPNFSIGRGRGSSGGSALSNISTHSLGAVLDQGENTNHDHSPLMYSRIKLLDVYRTTDVRSHKGPLDGFYEIPPSLTQAEPLEPLALSAPSPEELVILKGIDKGDIVSSGMPQASKEGSAGRSSTDLVQMGRTKIGSKEDLRSASDDYKEDSADNSNSGHLNYSDSPFEKYVHSYGSELKSEAIHNLQTHQDNKFSIEGLRSDPASYNRASDVPITREVSMQGSPAHSSTPWRSESLGERQNALSHDWRDLPPHIRSRPSDMGWSQLQKDRDTSLENSSTVAQSYYKDQPNWQVREGIHSDYGRESTIRRQLSDIQDKEKEARKFLSQTSPEDLSLYYKDPQGEIQGPFSGSDLIGWFEAGYFGIDLQVRVANATPGTPFSSLGDVMPHLRAKAKAPPGFGVPKQNEISDTINRPSFSNLGMVHANSSEADILKAEPRNRNGSMAEAENRFLESLMSGSLSSPLEKFGISEGLQGYMGNTPVGMPHMGLESGKDLNYLLAQRMSLDRQRSMPNSHLNWPGRDAASALPKSELAPESPTPHPRQVPLSQNVDLISLLQGVADKSASSAINNGASSWSNFPVQGGLDMRQDKMDTNHNQHFPQMPYGVQQQRLHPQNQQSLTNIIGQPLDNSSGIITPEKLLSSGLSQDQQVLSLLQHQYLLKQLHPQTSATSQLSLLDQFILLKQQQEQQQKQKQEQQLLLQQHLLSQVLSEQHSHQRLSEQFGHLQGAANPAVNGPIDHLGLRAPYETYQSNSQPLSNFQGGVTGSVFPTQVSQDVGHGASSEASSLHSPNQTIEYAFQKVKEATGKEQIFEAHQKESLLVPSMAGSSSLPEATQSSSNEFSVLQKHGILPESWAGAKEQALQNNKTNDTSESSMHSIPSKRPGVTESYPNPIMDKNDISAPERINDVRNLSSDIFEKLQVQKEQIQCEPPLVKENRSDEALEVKKVSEKKSRKQKNSKANSSSDKIKGVSQTKQSEIDGTKSKDSKINVSLDAGETLYGTPPVNSGATKSGMYTMQTVGSQEVQSLSSDNNIELVEGKVQDQPKEGDFMSHQNAQTQSSHRAWKPAPGFKPKSLLEIQEEEERVAHKQTSLSETTSVNSVPSSLPWTGIVGNMEPKTTRDSHQEAKSDSVSIPKSKKSQLHDLLAEEVLAKSEEQVLEIPDSVSSVPSVPVLPKQTGSAVDEDDFIQAKDSKKSRKKSGKAKSVGVKALTPVASADASVASSPIEKGKSHRQVQMEKEVLPAPPSGPSLGDFVLWKGEPANSSPVPAWSTDSGKLSKATSLRDIQKEQGKKVPSIPHQAPIPTPQKAQPTRGTRGNGTSWTPSGSSPSKSASPIQVNAVASAQSKSKVEDDLFWGPLDQSKQDAKQSAFPSLANPSSRGYKTTPVKGTLGGSSSRQKSMGSKSTDYSLSSSPATTQSSLKGRRDAITKHSEAMDFRDWCESETVRLTGSKDTSFLEFCLKQSTSEAEILLIENLGSFDPEHEFIEKFLNYKELLSGDVLEIAFQGRNDRKAEGFGVRDGITENTSTRELDPDVANESSKGGGKKKGKKGKKVNPAVLGFNVVSNRIMMGEIQTVEE